MSIVQRAIERLQRGDTRTNPADRSSSVRIGMLSSAPGPARDDESSNHQKVLIDLKAVRAEGYLPDASEDRRFADQYRQLKRPLIAAALGSSSTSQGSPALIMMTSALPGDGKTFTSINLALSLARERDLSVVLVDADLAKPHISRIFGLDAENGLLTALKDESVDVESLVLDTNLRGLSILPAGRPDRAATELLSSVRMRQIVARLQERDPRRLILFDSSPLLVSSESTALADVVGQVVLVVRSGKTPRQAVLDSITKLGQGCPVSLILNQGRPSISQSYYYGADYGDAKTN